MNSDFSDSGMLSCTPFGIVVPKCAGTAERFNQISHLPDNRTPYREHSGIDALSLGNASVQMASMCARAECIEI